MGKLSNKKIVIAGSRKIEEMSLLIEKQGGTPVIRSLQGLLYFDESAIERELLFCVNNKIDWFVLTTGTGTDTLLGAAERLRIHAALIQKLKEAKVSARGYKTYALLKKLDIKPEIVDEDGTTQGLIRSMNLCDFAGQTVVVQLHGEPQPDLIQFLENRGANVIQLLPYRHVEPESSTLEMLCHELSTSSIDAVCFTTAVQVRYLFNYAKRQGFADTVRESFNSRVRAVAVGKVTEEALREEGLAHVIVPEIERMGAMVIEIVKYYENQYLP
ncbi:uroporphyrinogen-III synthase [Paenibacillus alginolyticus]|uniref:Uroporphyrinogen-III synthase n=1 Tax=Paenibacillus alginolyticus TaxID=59839 RepID=A0ABT4G6E1_9BACL|nr:uroporphyrinogen-III synthase [Paenibacillus alginolyticus]MCY9667754.1 uroporphyrinogen-III synthase [Paenibacillus alginolyticus]MCY9691725.1 uroporphyrinogen-III synthase [Paenibacillus alginolyticus]MEC0144076.1 uroporphyrinogen-III synthase [Paenibacillus alginolyticus]